MTNIITRYGKDLDGGESNEFLVQNNYNFWKQEVTNIPAHMNMLFNYYQKRVDVFEDYEHYPLCQCNNKLFINILEAATTNLISGVVSSSYEIELCAENNQQLWYQFKIYSIDSEDIQNNLNLYEKDILDFWKLANEKRN